MQRLAVILSVALVLIGSPVSASVLESPASGAYLSGLGFISGWKCDAGEITVRIDGGRPLPVLYGNDRLDTHVSMGGPCQHPDTGYILQMNWAELGDGMHTVVAYDDGQEFDRATFRVLTFGEVFVRDARRGFCEIPDFPALGDTAEFLWNESTQHLELYLFQKARTRAEICQSCCGHNDVAGICVEQAHIVATCDCAPNNDPPEEEPSDSPEWLGDCYTADGGLDMCCFCCRGGEVARSSQSMCSSQPFLQRCGCGPSTPEQPDTEAEPVHPYFGHWTLASTMTDQCSSSEGDGTLLVGRRGSVSGRFSPHNDTVRVRDGVYRRPGRYELSGVVSPTGDVQATWSFLEHRGSLSGTLYETGMGSGTWRNSAGCRGVWRATR